MRKKDNTRRKNIRRAASVILAVLFSLLTLSSCAGSPWNTNDIYIPRTEPETTIEAETVSVVITSPVTMPDIDTVLVDETTAAVTTKRPTTDPPETEPEEDPVRLSFVGMGDNIIYGCTYRQAEKSDGGYDFLPKYKRVSKMIADADIAFVNQETPMSGKKYGYSSYPQFNTPDQMGYDLVTLGFDVISFANNHMADMGYNSSSCVSDMIDFTDKLDAFVVGLYRSYDDFENIRVYEKDGVKIAFLAYTYGTNLYKKQTEPKNITGAYLPVYDEETITRQVTAAKLISDLVIVSVHWGTEDSHKVNDEQRQYAQLMADLGVDVILGHHPHVIQSVEWIESENGYKTLCYYSLGNGLNAQDYLKNMVGITASFDIVKDKDGTRIENPSCIPTFNIMTPGYKNISLIPLNELTDDIAREHHCNNTDQKVTVEKAYGIVKNNISAEFLPDYLK